MRNATWFVGLGLLLGSLLGGCGNPNEGEAEGTVQNRGQGKENWWDALPRRAWKAFERIDIGPTDQGWFEVYAVRPGVCAIYKPGQFEEAISYLISSSTAGGARSGWRLRHGLQPRILPMGLATRTLPLAASALDDTETRPYKRFRSRPRNSAVVTEILPFVRRTLAQTA